MANPGVLLNDDYTLVRDGMRTILEPHWEIVGEATEGRGAGASRRRAASR
jgi:DNA-binding NarL/FixJ family response regulator